MQNMFRLAIGVDRSCIASAVIDTFEEWFKYYSKPDLIRMDAEGCHVSEIMSQWASRRDVKTWICPGEAHWLLGKTERRVNILKRALTCVLPKHHGPPSHGSRFLFRRETCELWQSR